jgi:hypothetical protein
MTVGVRGVVEAVDKLEAEGDQQRDKQQQIGQKRRDPGAAGVDVGIEAVRHVEQTTCKQQQKDDNGARIDRTIKLGAR